MKKPMAGAHALREVYELLHRHYGPLHWWPADTPTEVVVGAILTQNTAWTNVERAMANLKQAGCLTWAALRDIPETELCELIRPSGTYRIKASRLKAFVARLWSDHDGSLPDMLGGKLEDARDRLLEIRGVGPETADAILLYAGGRPTFVIDAYTRRVLGRHFLADGDAGYEELRAMFHRALTPEPGMFNQFHALFVEVGKRHCGAKAKCEGCPLAGLPHEQG